MKKRLIAILTAVTMIVTSMIIPTVAFAESTDVEFYAEDMALLSALDLFKVEIDEELGFDANETVLASDFIAAVVKLKLGTVEEGVDYLSVAKQYSMLNVETEYKTTDVISFNDAVKVIVDALGYDLIAEARGGYPYGYMNVARDIELFEDVEYLINQELTLGCAIKLLANAVDAPITQYGTYGETKYTFVAKEGNTLLSTYRDIAKVEGLVRYNGQTGIDSVSALLPNQVQIGDKVYNAGETNVGAMLGKYVKAYVSGYKNTPIPTVIFVTDNHYRNTELVISSDDVVEANDNLTSITYEKKINSFKKINVSAAKRVIYNGVVYYDYTKNDVIDDGATLRFVDNDGDNAYDIIFVDRYDKHLLVGSTSTGELIIYSQYKAGDANDYVQLDKENPEYYAITLTDGTPIKFKDIQKNDVVSVSMSKNKSFPFIKVVVSRDTVIGEMKSYNAEEREVVISTENGDYVGKFNKVFIDEVANSATSFVMPEYGSTQTFVLDATGSILGYIVTDAKGGWDYALLYSISKESELSTDVDVRYLKSSGDWVLAKLAKKVKCSEGHLLTEEVTKKDVLVTGVVTKTAEQIYGNLTGQGKDRMAPQVIMYKADEAGNITQLKLAINTTEVNSNVLTMTTATYQYDPSRHFYNNMYHEDNAPVFVLPKDGMGRPEDYFVTSSGYFTLNGSYTATFYDVDEYRYAKAISLKQTENTGSLSTQSMFLISEVREEINSDMEHVTKIYGSMGNYTEISAEINFQEDPSKGDNAQLLAEAYAYLKPGNIVQFVPDSKGRISSMSNIRCVYNANEALDKRLGSGIGSNPNLYSGIAAGKIKKIDITKGRLCMTNMAGGEERFSPISTSKSFTFYDAETKEIVKGTAADLMAGDLIIVQAGIYNISSGIAIRNYEAE